MVTAGQKGRRVEVRSELITICDAVVGMSHFDKKDRDINGCGAGPNHWPLSLVACTEVRHRIPTPSNTFRLTLARRARCDSRCAPSDSCTATKAGLFDDLVGAGDVNAHLRTESASPQ
jgi:hypothetical protein